MIQVGADFPAKLQPLFEPHRYKVGIGGRGGAKSWGFARALLIRGAQNPLLILCARETQKSIKDSVHKLLKKQIRKLGLQDCYLVQKTSILGTNGTEFMFAGLKHNVADIKSLEDCDIVWVEEADNVSKDSWDTLIPTIRKDGSEIWVSFNPKLRTDDTYQRFVVRTPSDTALMEINWRDNPWFPPVLKKEMEDLREKDPEACDHVYEGHCISMVAGAIYANEFRKVDSEQRITRVPYDGTKLVNTFWDLGWADYVSIWCVQAFPFEYRVIDFIEGNRHKLADYLKKLDEKPYLYGTHYLPHDAKAHSLGSGKSVEELMREGARKVQVLPAWKKTDGINAVRTLLGQCYFDAEKTADGVQHLRHYRYGTITTLGTDTREPLHDEHSHAADAFEQFAIGIQVPLIAKKKGQEKRRAQVSVWS